MCMPNKIIYMFVPVMATFNLHHVHHFHFAVHPEKVMH